MKERGWQHAGFCAGVRQMRMWIIPALGRRSSPGCWNPRGLGSAYWPSRTGGGRAKLSGAGKTPRYGFSMVSGGNIDSAWWPTTQLAKRAPHAKMNIQSRRQSRQYRPDRSATIVYTRQLKKLFPSDVPVMHRRTGGLFAPVCPLRLLGRRSSPVGAGRRGGGSFVLRNGGKPDQSRSPGGWRRANRFQP